MSIEDDDELSAEELAEDERRAQRAEEMNRAFEEAPTREEKLEVLKLYMSESMAENAIGYLLGEHNGDCVDESGGDFGRSARPRPTST